MKYYIHLRNTRGPSPSTHLGCVGGSRQFVYYKNQRRSSTSQMTYNFMKYSSYDNKWLPYLLHYLAAIKRTTNIIAKQFINKIDPISIDKLKFD